MAVLPCAQKKSRRRARRLVDIGDVGGSAFRRRLDHAERVQIGVEDCFLFHTLLLVLLAQRHDLLQDLGIEAHSLGFAIDVLDVVVLS